MEPAGHLRESRPRHRFRLQAGVDEHRERAEKLLTIATGLGAGRLTALTDWAEIRSR